MNMRHCALRERLEMDPDKTPGHSSLVVGVVAYGFAMGGMERIVVTLVGVLQKAGARVVLLTACPPDEDFFKVPDCIPRICVGKPSGGEKTRLRLSLMKEALQAHKPDILIFHSYFSPALLDEIVLAQSMGIKTIVHCHSVGANLFARKALHIDPKRQFKAFRQADALIAMSRADALYFRCLGIRARYIPNPVRDVPSGFRRKPNPGHSIAWIGRFEPYVKRPLDAIRIFALIRESIPDATLSMIGDGPAMPDVDKFIKANPSVAGAVRMPGKLQEVWEELGNVDLLLLTSLMEGFPGVVAEAYAAGVPVVGYRLDTVELCNVQGAFHAVDQEDVESAAVAAIRLLKDPAALRAASTAARTAFGKFAAVDLTEAYGRLFEDVLGGRDSQPAEEDPALYKSAISSFFDLACEGRALYVDAARQLAECRSGKTSRLWAFARRAKRFFLGKGKETP